MLGPCCAQIKAPSSKVHCGYFRRLCNSKCDFCNRVEEGVVAVVATVKSIPGGCLIGPLELHLFISQSGKLLCLQMIFS
ncbi:hypothetical protein BR93DRAFT_691166 [Coniochaeta sp. PMI_546]|nr:hypothetical protein BR93DRAFT_691166 [Coniochaeta sp. PMI_546]